MTAPFSTFRPLRLRPGLEPRHDCVPHPNSHVPKGTGRTYRFLLRRNRVRRGQSPLFPRPRIRRRGESEVKNGNFSPPRANSDARRRSLGRRQRSIPSSPRQILSPRPRSLCVFAGGKHAILGLQWKQAPRILESGRSPRKSKRSTIQKSRICPAARTESGGKIRSCTSVLREGRPYKLRSTTTVFDGRPRRQGRQPACSSDGVGARE